MRQLNIPYHRLYNQCISHHRFKKPEEIVKWMGAIQAQDYLGSLWAIGLRLKNNDESDIEKAITDRKIVRSWPMRGTLHIVPSEDLRWMLRLLTPRVIKRAAALYKQAGLDSKVFAKSRRLFAKELRDGQRLTRNELYTVLERSGISTGDQRGLHILGYLAQEGLICFGPRKGKQQTFVLLDDWIPVSKMPAREEALATLTLNYFNSHGPATAHDFAWWSGLTMAEVKHLLETVRPSLRNEQVGGQVYWMSSENNIAKATHNVFLLPSYDEYLVAYKNRNLAMDPGLQEQIRNSGNGIFYPPIIVNGIIAGTWKRSISKDETLIETNLFTSVSKPVNEAITIAARRFGKFSDTMVVVKESK